MSYTPGDYRDTSVRREAFIDNMRSSGLTRDFARKTADAALREYDKGMDKHLGVKPASTAVRAVPDAAPAPKRDPWHFLALP